MELLEPNNNLSKYFGCFLKSENSIFEFGLIVDEISTIAILQDKVDVLIVLGHIIQLYDIV